MLSVLIALALAADPAGPAGIEVHGSDCASGGFDWFFFADGVVIAQCWGCDERPYVRLGVWQRKDGDIQVTVNHEWFGKGRGSVLPPLGSVERWSDYVAVARPVAVPRVQETFKPEDFTANGKDGCDFAQKHDRSPDPHAFLRQFAGEHPETFQRVLQRAELMSASSEQLRLMRNEVFARYGYRFKDPALAAVFAKVKSYDGYLSNVDDFLSAVERENVNRIAVAEAAAQGPNGAAEQVRALVTEYAAADEKAVDNRAEFVVLPEKEDGTGCCANLPEFSCVSHPAVLVSGWALKGVNCHADECLARVRYHRVGSVSPTHVVFEAQREEVIEYRVVLTNGGRRIQGPALAHVAPTALAECLRHELEGLTPVWWEKASTEQRTYADTAKRKLEAIERR